MFSKSALQLGEDVPYYCWTDSQIVLSWIRGNPGRWKMFVHNRVVEIQSLTSPCHWYHCPGKDNPADMISRGVYAEQLVSSDVWLYGPSWLSQSSAYFPNCKISPVQGDLFQEENVLSCVVLDPSRKLVDFEHWSTFSKICRILVGYLDFVIIASLITISCLVC